MTTIAEFLTARYDEIEAAARAVTWTDDSRTWTIDSGGYAKRYVVDALDHKVVTVDPAGISDAAATAEHIALHDPAYELRKIEVDRAILAIHTIQGSLVSDYTDCAACMDVDAYDSYPCQTVRLLALPFASHPEYREEWAP